MKWHAFAVDESVVSGAKGEEILEVIAAALGFGLDMVDMDPLPGAADFSVW